MDYTDRINRLREELNRHNHNYYVLNAPEISDKDFDMLMKELEELERIHPEEGASGGLRSAFTDAEGRLGSYQRF